MLGFIISAAKGPTGACSGGGERGVLSRAPLVLAFELYPLGDQEGV